MARGPAQRDTRGIVIGIRELERVREKFADLETALKESTELADAIGEQQVASAKRRIRQTKKSPEGKPWQPWSQKYAKTRKRQHSLLIASGALRDSITHHVLSPGEVEVGSNLDYARAHLMGTEDIPARPYLDTEGGFADPHDRAEIRDILRDFLRDELSKP
jgi:phage virion morphogenesis protein